MMQNRWFGPYAVFYWSLILFNMVMPQVLWLPKVRANTRWLFLISLVILIGMWLERFIIIVTSLHRDFLPSSWGHYVPTRWDYARSGRHARLLRHGHLHFIRIMPAISIFEMRTLLPEVGGESKMSHHSALTGPLRLARRVRYPDRSGRCRTGDLCGRIPQDRCLQPLSLRRGQRGHWLPQKPGAADRVLGGLLGGLSGFGLQYWINVIAYPLNIGGKPYDSWPAFIVPTFELTILFAGLFGCLRDVRPEWVADAYHPLFNVDRFAGVTRDKFFLCVEAADPKFDIVDTQQFMESLNPVSITEVPH